MANLLWKNKLEQDLLNSQKPKMWGWNFLERTVWMSLQRPTPDLSTTTKEVDLPKWDFRPWPVTTWPWMTLKPSIQDLEFQLEDTMPTPKMDLPDTWFSFIPQAQASWVDLETWKVTFDENDIEDFNTLLNNWFTQEEAKEALIKIKQEDAWYKQPKTSEVIQEEKPSPFSLEAIKQAAWKSIQPLRDIWEGIAETWKWFKFQSGVDDSIIESWLKFIWNLPWNTAELAWNTITVVSDPAWTAKSLKTLAESTIETALNKALLDEWEEVFTSEENKIMSDALTKEFNRIANEPWRLKELLVENPADVLFAVEWWLRLAWSKAWKLWLTKTSEKINKLANVVDPIKLQTTIAKPVVKWTAKALWKTGELLWEWFTKTTWVNLDTVKNIVKNPELFKQAEKWLITRQTTADDVVKAIDKKASSISDIWKEYSDIRKQKVNIDDNDISKLKTKIDKTLSDNDIIVKDWKLDFSNSAIWQTWNRKAIQDAYNLIKNRTEFNEWKDWLNLRQSIDDTINYKSDATTRWENIIKWIRSDIDDIAKTKLKWLKELDAKFAPERSEFDRINKLIRNKDWTLKDNYISTIANITWKWKELKLDRIKKILPDIEDKVNALKALEDVNLAKWQKVGSYMNAWIVWGAWLAWWVPWAIAAYVITHPWTLVRLLKWYTWAKWLIKSIWDKIRKWIKISDNESNVVSNFLKDQAKITEQIENIPKK